MATFQKQSWGSAGQLRDLDFVNPRQKKPPSALPPEVRARLRLPSNNAEPNVPVRENRFVSEEIYTGAKNAARKVGQSGAGTDWDNPNGHAFVRRGSGIPMSHRASRKAQLERGSSLQDIRNDCEDRPRSSSDSSMVEMTSQDNGGGGGHYAQANGKKPTAIQRRDLSLFDQRTGSSRPNGTVSQPRLLGPKACCDS